MRIGGLASGMDIDSMVKKLMTAARVPLDKLNQQKQQLEWKREGYRTISTTLVGLNDKLSTFGRTDSINSKKATVTGASNVTATATGAATNSVLNIKVSNLATASSVVSTNGVANATKISEVYSNGAGSITIGTATINFSADETIDSLVKKINNDKSTGVTAVYDTASGKMSFTNRETGEKNITLSGDLLTSLGMTTVNKGMDAVVEINGLTTKQSSNNFTINGVNISLKGATPAGETSQIQVSQDVDKMVETIKSFVDSYNATIATLNQKTSEERFRKFLPLSTEQKGDMKEDEIKLWETKAKSGMLRNDSIIDKSLSDMRSAMITDVELPDGSKINMTQIGITTGKYSENGKLVLDETKLRAALDADPEKVSAIFGQTDYSTKTDYTPKDGLFNRLKKIDNVALASMYEKAGTSQVSSDLTTAFMVSSQMGDQLRDFETKIADLNKRLTMKETQYYKQFTAMETAMNKYNSTSSSLTSMLS
ncbi:flagellar filament capping protein FliD [Paenibacillus jilunlii]|uniref:Flagellar hook-associated protein 2 n=1 Tax=Paenibacillus jilunlii TaxID=682956 RepID=A0A1G9VPQ0_9BACL|nr:flagellar filament capping protein FliD [Paenibacillus jilunlii]KWX75863.1 flagellar cap protein FliD [Paenibacillus jilunlii]SDM74120.1 flagellar hook-associated protein 2 [Paenibacillus jilunlii]